MHHYQKDIDCINMERQIQITEIHTYRKSIMFWFFSPQKIKKKVEKYWIKMQSTKSWNSDRYWKLEKRFNMFEMEVDNSKENICYGERIITLSIKI